MGMTRWTPTVCWMTCVFLMVVGCSREPADNAAADPQVERNPQAEAAGGNAPSQQSRQTATAPGPSPPIEMLPAARAEQESDQSQEVLSTELSDDLSPEELRSELAAADHRMRMLIIQANEDESSETAAQQVRTVIERKLEAARRLAEHPDASEKLQTQGKRGELQALSHLASLGRGDVLAAEQLERLAKQYVETDDPELYVDSQLVLIGFAIESLHHGKQEAADTILSQVENLAKEVSPGNLPALMVMGQARQALQEFNHQEEATRIRQLIVEHFGQSGDPEVAQVAADIANVPSEVRYTQIESLRVAALEGDDVGVEQWRETAEGLIDSYEDIMSVRYLSAAAYDLEVAGRADLATATYQLLQDRFSESNRAMDREAQAAVGAHTARQEAIGRPFDLDLQSIDGSPLPFDTFRGQIVLMPFWDTRFRQSLAALPQLREIRDAQPGKIELVGMNLDEEGADVQAFIDASGIDFPSYRSATAVTSNQGNQVANRFGLWAFPFTLVIDRDGKVAAVAMNPRTLQQAVNQLLEP